MASSRKRPSAEHIAVGLSGGVDSVVLLHLLREQRGIRLQAVHVHHGLSPNADAWADFCRSLCKRLRVPLQVKKVKVQRQGKGLEAAARDARYRAFEAAGAGTIALAHNLDDQAETVLMNLLRGAGTRGASGMAERSRLRSKVILRPLLGKSRREILAYARERGLEWIEDESNADQSLTRNFIRRRVAPLLEERFPKWRESLARAARHFSKKEAGSEELLRNFLAAKGLKAPSEAKLLEMLKQLGSRGARTLIEHDGAKLRVYRNKVLVDSEAPRAPFTPLSWTGERRLGIPALGGELVFRRVRGQGIDPRALDGKIFTVKLRSGGERLRVDPRRPRRTLKNLFQEAGVPPWERERLPLLYCGDELAWAPGLGVDERFRAAPERLGWGPQWPPRAS